MKMNRRIIRTLFQLAAIAIICFIFALYLDNRYSVLPTSIHNHLPAHHPGLVITDITIKQCSSFNLISSCRLDQDEWQRLEKDLLLDKSLFNEAYLWVKRKQEAELGVDDKVVVDVRVSRVQPVAEKDKNWEQRPAGLWVLRSAQRHESDSHSAITEVDVLFGPDAVDPRPGWTLRSTPLSLDSATKGLDPHLTVRRGPVAKHVKPVPRIGKDGKFKILQVADLHLSTGIGVCRDPEPKGQGPCDADPRTLDFISRVVDSEKPDLVVLTGDQVNGDTAPDVQTAILKFADVFIRRSLPFAAIFGNHDDEGPLNRWESMAILESLPYSLSEPGPSTASGVGNYVVEVRAAGTSTHSALSLYLLDSHKYSPDDKTYPGYDWIKPDQITWFHNTAKGLKESHRKYTKIHMDLAFIHIPLPEYRDADHEVMGAYREAVAAPTFNSHFADALAEEGVMLVSAGHDHANDYCMIKHSGSTELKPQLWMCYGGGSGFGGYGGYGGYHRRVRLFDIDTNTARITTYKRLEYGDTERRLDEQVIVDGGRVVVY